MTVFYPSTFPQPLFEGYAATVAMGVIRSDMPSHQAQRRVFKTMPHTVSLAFIMSVAQWGAWDQWVSSYGYVWFAIDLPTLYAGLANANTSSVLIRFTSEVSAANVSADQVQVSMTAELAPSMIATLLDAT